MAVPEPTPIVLGALALLVYIAKQTARSAIWCKAHRTIDGLRRAAVVALAILLSVASTTCHAAEFFGLATGPDIGGRLLSGDGSTLILEDVANTDILLWRRDEGLQAFGFPDGFPTGLNFTVPNQGEIISDIADDGRAFASVFGRRIGANLEESVFLWDDENGFRQITPARTANFSGEFHRIQLANEGETLWVTQKNNVWRWTEEAGLQAIELFPTKESILVLDAHGSSAVGQVTFDAPGPDTSQAFLWSPDAGLVELSEAPGVQLAAANAMTPDGSVIVGSIQTAGGSREAFRWTPQNGISILSRPPAFEGMRATFVSDDGSIIAGEFRRGADAKTPFIWSEETGTVPINGLRDPLHFTYKLTTDGSRLFFQTLVGPPPVFTQYVWDRETGTQTLNHYLESFGLVDAMEGWQLSDSRPLVSDDGNIIVGRGIDPNGMSDLWIAILGDDVALPGDYNNNGLVEQADLDLVLLHWGADAASAPPTWTNDLPTGAIDQDELDKVLLGWGSSSTVAATIVRSIPEPSTWLLVAIAALVGHASRASPGNSNRS